MPSFKAIYLGEDAKLYVRQIDEPYTPTGSQSLIQVKYSAINPADLKHHFFGMHSSVAGYEWVGPVMAVGPDSPYKVGELLFGFAMWGPNRPLHKGAHQDYLLAETFGTYRVPENMRGDGLDEEERNKLWRQVVSWPAGAQTAIDILFSELGFAFPEVKGLEKGTDPKGRAILVWGGSSVLGMSVIQLAKAAGFSPIYTTASPQNHKGLLELGVTQAFDYNSPSVVDEIRSAVASSGKPLSVIADAVTAGTGFGEPPSETPVDISASSPAMAKKALTDGADDVRLVASLPVTFDPEWRFPQAMRPKEQFPMQHEKLNAGVAWLWMNHKGVFHIPNVRVAKGAKEGIKAIQDVYEGKVSMEKVVIEHPL